MIPAMLTNPVKLRFRREKRFGQSKKLSKSKTNVERMETSPDLCKEEYLTNKNLSIMTDTILDRDVVDNVCLREKKHDNARTSNSSFNADLQDSYFVVSTEETPVKLKDVNWEYVEYNDIVDNVGHGCVMKKYCSPKCSTAWFLKIRREILKNCRRKIYPLAVDG